MHQSMCKVTSAGAVPAALGHSWRLVCNLHTHLPLELSSCVTKGETPNALHQCTWTVVFVIPVCRQHIQLLLCFHCDRDITHDMSCSLPILGWKKHKLMAGLHSRAAAQALRGACWEREHIRGGGQVRMSWALKWETSRDHYPLL